MLLSSVCFQSPIPADIGKAENICALHSLPALDMDRALNILQPSPLLAPFSPFPAQFTQSPLACPPHSIMSTQMEMGDLLGTGQTF